MNRLARGALWLLGPALLLAVWHLAVRSSGQTHFPAPWQVVVTIADYWPNPEFLRSVVASLRRVLIGFAVGSLVGIPVGVLMGMRPATARLLQMTTELLRPIAPLAWVPLAIIWLGLNERATIFVIAYAVFFPTLLHAMAGVRSVDPLMVDAALTMGANRWTIAREVMLPAALPEVMTGLRIGAGLAWGVIVAAELAIASSIQSGIGYLMMRYSVIFFKLDRILALVVAVGLVGVSIDSCLLALQRRLTAWRAGIESKT